MWEAESARHGYPTYGEDNKLAPLPEFVYLNWADRVDVYGTNQDYQQWTLHLPRMIEGYKYATLEAWAFDHTAYTEGSPFWGLQIQEFGGGGLMTSNINPLVFPTWMVPDNGISANVFTTPSFTPLYMSQTRENAPIDIQGVNVYKLHLSITNGLTQSLPTVVGSPSVDYFNTALIRLWK